MELNEILSQAVTRGAADIFLIAGSPVAYRVGREISRADADFLRPNATEELIGEIYRLADRAEERLLQSGDDDFSFSVAGLSRFRVSTYRQRGSLAAVIRVIRFGIPDARALGIPEAALRAADSQKGMVLVTGPAGSGKSTTQACMIDRINASRACHIITLEEPIEFLHSNKRGIVSQREVEQDSRNYMTALRACLRQAPDVILVGEMRDSETIATAMTAAETGHLVISTLHTVGAANTIDRIIDSFPAAQQQQIRVQLAMTLNCVVSQQLVPAKDGALALAVEIMYLNNAIRTLIRDSKIHQIDGVIASSSAEGMVGMDASLLELVRSGRVEAASALNCAQNPEQMRARLNLR